MPDMKLEIVVLPVSDVDRAKAFYTALGWREDADFPGAGGFRVIQLTPPGSPASVIFGSGITDAAPGSAQGLHLVVTDIEATRARLAEQGVPISEVFHDAGGVFHHTGTEARVSGPDPDHTSYASFASFSDPDGNGWVLQEITTRLPGRVTDVTFSSAAELAGALRRAAAAHGEHEKELGHQDADWPAWYAEYLVRHGLSGT
ncbi:VOC family protein [Amycolatopsis sp. NBC_00348]|uniref:VOC family protein n=1 Tax=Amycolatopsis sp. NBC_00348 TaxID=2975956 RepID=UPI002E275A21